jgi:Tol biopolymer transport system component
MFDPGYETPGIYVYDTETCQVTRATTGRSDGQYLSWSPDGSKIAFTKYDPEGLGRQPANSDIFVIGLQSGLETRMTSTPEEQESSPRWSFDGSLISFEAVRLDQLPNRDRRSKVNVVSVDQPEDVSTLADDTCYPLHSWSPVRPELALSDCRGIKIMDMSGQMVGHTEARASWGSPAWSSDGESVAYTCGASICVVRRDGSENIQIDGGASGEFPAAAWTPAGEISFSGGGKLFIADPRSGRLLRMIDGWRGVGAQWLSSDRAASVNCLATPEIVAPCPRAWSLVDPATLGTAYLMPVGCGSGSGWSPNGRYLAVAFGGYPVACG